MKTGLTLFLAAIMMLFLCACGRASAQHPPAETSVSAQTTAETTTEITTCAITEAPTETEPPQPVTVYQHAVEDYLLPLTDFSRERIYDPEMIMIHFTSAIMTHRDDPYNITYIRDIFIDYEVSIHYIIERDGTVHCYIPEDLVAWHAGPGEFQNDPKYTDRMNDYAIGIELVGIGSESDMSIYMTGSEYRALEDSLKGFTQAQYDALKPLVEDLCSRYAIPLDRAHIIGHEDYSPEKTDPGELFDWSRIIP